MDQTRTSPRNMVIAFVGAAALAVGAWFAVAGPAAVASDHAGKKTTTPSAWR